MTSLKDRDISEERKFALSEEQHFRAEARRNKLLGLWAAGLMQMSEQEAGDYANDVVMACIKGTGGKGVFQKIRTDFDDKNVKQTDHQIRRTMDELMQKVATEIKNDD